MKALAKTMRRREERGEEVRWEVVFIASSESEAKQIFDSVEIPDILRV